MMSEQIPLTQVRSEPQVETASIVLEVPEQKNGFSVSQLCLLLRKPLHHCQIVMLKLLSTNNKRMELY